MRYKDLYKEDLSYESFQTMWWQCKHSFKREKNKAGSTVFYLESLITDNGSCSKEIRARIAIVTTAFNRLKELLTRGIRRKVKKKIIKTIVWSVLCMDHRHGHYTKGEEAYRHLKCGSGEG